MKKFSILFPPGCYGNYLAWNISKHVFKLNIPDINIDKHGSSHQYQQYKLDGIIVTHDIKKTAGTDTIIIRPQSHRYLDYFNNQFQKQHNLNLLDYIQTHMSINELMDKITTNYFSFNNFNEIPRWILREFISFWLIDVFASGYNIRNFKKSCLYTCDTEDIFYNIKKVLLDISAKLNADKIQLDSIDQTHQNFLKLQKYHNAQIRCDQWVDHVIDGAHMFLQCNTIFDEAYIQAKLRTKGYEIMCDGLDTFPTQAITMHKLIYKI